MELSPDAGIPGPKEKATVATLQATVSIREPAAIRVALANAEHRVAGLEPGLRWWFRASGGGNLLEQMRRGLGQWSFTHERGGRGLLKNAPSGRHDSRHHPVRVGICEQYG
jgi:hypothetical protein